MESEYYEIPTQHYEMKSEYYGLHNTSVQTWKANIMESKVNMKLEFEKGNWGGGNDFQTLSRQE